MAFVEFDDVYKTYTMGTTEIHAIQGATFGFERGEFVVVVGPSGAGKTTILNLLGGMDQVTSGSIWLEDEQISSYSRGEQTEFRRDAIGFVFQFYNLVQNLTALENVELASEICKDPLDPREVLQLVGLGDRMDNFPAQLSGGEQQRVAIARAIAKNPLLLLADEPTGALDYETGKAVLGLLQEICHTHRRTVVVITHNLAFTELADRVIRVSNGQITEVTLNDSPKSAYEIEW
ncbi:MAG TPA: ABC transporter ATP-binding protein [Actinomycetaceae bacterium]|nr:ABC transporter ATP-binding protein [Actinomycetaceae bacterium]